MLNSQPINIVFGAVVLEGRSSTQSRQHLVEIPAFQFHPKQFTVAPGNIIVWVHRDMVPYIVKVKAVPGVHSPWKKGSRGKSWSISMFPSPATVNFISK